MPAIYAKANLAWKTAIKACREKAGLDQEALAKLVRMNQQDISKIETGRRPLRAAEIPLFAKAFGIPQAKLFETYLVFYDT